MNKCQCHHCGKSLPKPKKMIIPWDANELLRSKKINTTEFVVLTAIGSCHNLQNEGHYIGNEYIADEFGLSPHTVSLAITKLKRLGLLEVSNPSWKNRILITYWNKKGI